MKPDSGRVRRCDVCGATVGSDRPDACFGMIPGVVAACCGHGNPKHAYIHYETGTIVRGFTIQKRGNPWGQRVDD